MDGKMKNKNLLNLLIMKDGGYYKVPNRLYSLNLPMGTIAVYSYLLSCAEDFNPAGRVIAKALKISRTTVHKHLKELCDHNLIKMIQRGGKNRITKYQFCNPKDWKNDDFQQTTSL